MDEERDGAGLEWRRWRDKLQRRDRVVREDTLTRGDVGSIGYSG